MKTPALNEFKAWAQAHKQDALAVCMAQAYAQLERERVDAYVLPIFQRYNFQYGHEITRGQYKGPIPTPNELYLCEEEELIKDYYEECDKAHREHGFTGEHGYCPALVADEVRRKAENAFLRLGCELFGLDDLPHMTEHRKKMLDLLLGACLKDERRR